MAYYLGDEDTANLVGSHRTLRSALEAVLDTANRYGPSSPEVLSLGLTRGASSPLAHGRELLDLAERSADATASPRVPARHFRAGAWPASPPCRPHRATPRATTRP